MALMNWIPQITPKQIRIITKIFVGIFKKSFNTNNIINGSMQIYNEPSVGTKITRNRTIANPIRLRPPFELLGWFFGLRGVVLFDKLTPTDSGLVSCFDIPSPFLDTGLCPILPT